MNLRRRDVLVAFGAAVPLPALPALAGSDNASHKQDLYIHDIRMGRPVPKLQNARAYEFSGETSSLWFKLIKPSLMRGVGLVRGETFGDAVFCLNTLASDYKWTMRLTDLDTRSSDPQLCEPERVYRWQLSSTVS